MSGCTYQINDDDHTDLCGAEVMRNETWCAWHVECASRGEFGDTHRGPNQPEGQS